MANLTGELKQLFEVDALQRRADELQDALDDFNAFVKVEIEMD